MTKQNIANSINHTTTLEMLKVVGKAVLDNAISDQPRTYDNDPIWGVMLHNTMLQSKYTIFANENEGISILQTYYRGGKEVDRTGRQLFAFTKDYYNKSKERIPSVNSEIAKNKKAWLKDNLFLVSDYEKNKSIITDICVDLNWLTKHAIVGDYNSFLNRRRYKSIIKKCQEWVVQSPA